MAETLHRLSAWNASNPGVIQAVASALAVIVASIALVVTLTYYVSNLKVTRLSNSARMTIDLVNRFDSAEMRKQRSKFARSLLENTGQVDVRGDSPVLDLFEEIAYMARRRALDEGMVWNSFSWWLEPYYKASKTPIQDARLENADPTLYEGIEWLYKQMRVVSKKREGRQKNDPASDRRVHVQHLDDDVKSFLRNEIGLETVGKDLVDESRPIVNRRAGADRIQATTAGILGPIALGIILAFIISRQR